MIANSASGRSAKQLFRTAAMDLIGVRVPRFTTVEGSEGLQRYSHRAITG